MNLPEKAPTLINATVRVTRLRAKNAKGCIAFCHRVDLAKGMNDRSSALVISTSAAIFDSTCIEVGGIYEIYGESSTTQRTHGSYTASETQIEVQDIRLVRPSGSQLIQWISDSAKGIGEVKATKLWDRLGESLYEALDNEDHSAIEDVIQSDVVRTGLFETWAKNGDAKTLRFVQDKGIPLDLARKAIKFHKKNTIWALTDDPYRLLSFEGQWLRVDEIARTKFEISLSDPRRLAAALEASLFDAAKHGHTCCTLSDLIGTFGKLIKPFKADEALAKALLQGKEAGQFITRETSDGEVVLYAPGMFLMERECASFIKSLLKNPVLQKPLFPTDVDEVISQFERDERLHLGINGFSLNDAQRNAVLTSFENRFSVITGGAGVGKTTVLKALYKALDTLGRPRFQMALSGRATARMIEATQEPALTIAGFLRNAKEEEIGQAPIVVIDEASMLDLVTFYRLTQKLPLGTHMILVGDPYQLPPIGAGLVLHVLCDLLGLPVTQLTEVKRQAKESAIPAASKAIRNGEWPQFSDQASDEVALLECTDDEIIPTVIRLYEQDRANTQILSATRSCPHAGVETINRVCHVKYAGTSKQLKVINADTGELETTGFSEGDLLMYTANDWLRNLQNGCLGKLEKVYEKPRKVNIGSEGEPIIRTAISEAVFENVQHYLLDTDIDLITFAYAITVHKSQGSQFKRVIVPIRKSRVLDRTFVYTAATRAQVQVIFVGNAEEARKAIELPPRAFSRKVGLGSMIQAS